MEKKEFEFGRDSCYRLISVTDKDGRDKSQDGYFYEYRLGCIATDFHYDDFPTHGGMYRLNMKFVQNEKGQWIKRGLHTSAVTDIEETENGFILHTIYSDYTFEKAGLREVPMQDAKELIELYMSLNENSYFGKGFYYDEAGKAYELTDYLHVGTFQDSVLIRFIANETLNGCVCRYFPMTTYVEFYNTMYKQQDYSVPMLIHNTGKEDLQIRFERYPHTWTIKPGESKRIIPFKADGSDRKEECLSEEKQI